MKSVNEVNNDKTKVPMNFFFVLFESFVLLPNSKSKLIDNQCTCNLSTRICDQTGLTPGK